MNSNNNQREIGDTKKSQKDHSSAKIRKKTGGGLLKIWEGMLSFDI